MIYFNEDGRRVASEGLRIFSEVPQTYYQIQQPKIDYKKILNNAREFGGLDSQVSASNFESSCTQLQHQIEINPSYANLFKGVHIPFICKKNASTDDLGGDLENVGLPNYQKAFNAQFPENHFKAVLQSDSKLSHNIHLDPRSRYQGFLQKNKENILIGWYFPQALQEFDVESQRQQMLALPNIGNVCLSGGVDILSALIGLPELLISQDFYAPILCLSAYAHSDPRLVLLMKSYGPHMEFWCMTQMLTKNITQVSEQWSGGITVYQPL